MAVQYLALVRGINVGGRNLVKMADLRAAFESMGFADVATYIASGNVLFGAPRQRREALAARTGRFSAGWATRSPAGGSAATGATWQGSYHG